MGPAFFVLNMEEEQITEGYAFLTHAGRALALWRGRFPAEFIESIKFMDKTKEEI